MLIDLVSLLLLLQLICRENYKPEKTEKVEISKKYIRTYLLPRKVLTLTEAIIIIFKTHKTCQSFESFEACVIGEGLASSTSHVDTKLLLSPFKCDFCFDHVQRNKIYIGLLFYVIFYFHLFFCWLKVSLIFDKDRLYFCFYH